MGGVAGTSSPKNDQNFNFFFFCFKWSSKWSINSAFVECRRASLPEIHCSHPLFDFFIWRTLHKQIIFMAGTRSQANSDKLLDSSKLSKEGKAIVQLITGHIDILREEFGDIFREKDKEISNLKVELSSLKAKMAILEERHDDADAYERRNTLLISGDGVPHVAAGENCNALVCSMVKEKLKINISPNDNYFHFPPYWP